MADLLTTKISTISRVDWTNYIPTAFIVLIYNLPFPLFLLPIIHFCLNILPRTHYHLLLSSLPSPLQCPTLLNIFAPTVYYHPFNHLSFYLRCLKLLQYSKISIYRLYLRADMHNYLRQKHHSFITHMQLRTILEI